MKIAVHLSMLCATWLDDVTPYFGRLAQNGFDGVELSLYGADPGRLQEITGKLRELGLALSFGAGLSPDTDISSSDPENRQNGIVYLNRCLEDAARFGAEHLSGVLYAPWFSFCSPREREARRERSAAVLRQIGARAASLGVAINLEVLNRFECDFMNTLAEGENFLNRLGCPSIRLLADTFHINIEENNIPEAVDQHYSSIGCLHVCENHRGVPGTGHIPWRQLLWVLHRRGYTGWLTMESFVQAGTEVGEALHIYRDSGDPLERCIAGKNYLAAILRETGGQGT